MWGIFKIINLFYFFFSSFAWWSFFFPRNYIPVFVDIIMMICLMFSGFKLRITQRAVIILVTLFLFSAFSGYILMPMYGLVVFFTYLPALFLYVLPSPKKLELLSFVTKWFSLILLFSIVVYFATYIISFPVLGVFKAEDLNYPPYDNYLFFIKQRMYDNFVYRFNAWYLEPGHLAMIGSLLLFANKFNFKQNKYLWIILTGIFLSFSLAGYIITIIGFALLYVKSIPKLVIFIVALIGLNWFITDIWNGGDNPVNVLIFERLQFDRDKGISGNNRTTEMTDNFFEECVKDGTIILGVRTMKADNLRIRGAGYKIFILRYGLISLMFVLIIYMLLQNPKANKRYAYSFFILIIVIFIQRAYPNWYSWLLPFVLGIGVSLRTKPNYFIKLRLNED